MEVKIGIKHVARELVLESTQSPEAVASLISEAVGGKTGLLTLVDEKGRRVVVPVDALAYVEIAESEARRVGFGTS
ncbi:ATP-binding protein [Frankia sp. CcI49]|uniref:ATP-binding protein n=1 Tax=Parafrankia irregularis TaxID=795642 RepID=A0A0S4QTB9_9ACTN|nr:MULTISPECIES: DUF3107 domain-containing protein [Frankiaceae]EFC81521.1 hypothetical protein FrEUN1fDRAFT_5350 [Parafrankia sp. EUN1f]KPM57410.1 ATP-binding protein [Frankia sp. R43]MBE3205174.1 DUF3107 domain-containing protein [Parafrankia sp. CH37]ONH53579.1 ATP-binding protein [Frankia sp. CcI49]CUU58871.1 Protein of unknown function (DUF3107) [Parafrankia irregularis]